MQKSELESIEIELSDAKKAVRDLALKIEEANSRSKHLQRKPKWRQQEDPETSVKTETEDVRYTEVMNELEHMKQEMQKLKVDMARVLKEKRRAERATKASSSKRSTLLASIELMQKELQELDEEQTIVDFARIEAVNECESIEVDTKTKELQVTLFEESPMNSITEELTGAKQELETVKGEGFKFMTSMDVIRDELVRVREEMVRLKEAEQKRELTVQSLNSKLLRAKAKLESLASAESRTNTVVSNLAVTLEQVRAEAETAKKDRDVVNEEIENMKGEIDKTEYEIDVTEDRLEAAIEELKGIKASEAKAMGNLRNMINTSVEARDMGSKNGSMITISGFEYEYLTGKAGGAAELADKKIAASQAWVEALKASEREILMKIEMKQRDISELSVETDPEPEVEGPEPGLREKAVDSPRRSVSRVRNKVTVKRVSLQKFRSPGARNSGKLGSMQSKKMMPKVKKYFSPEKVAMDEGMV